MTNHERHRKQRIELGISQHDLAKRIGRAGADVCNYEQGRYPGLELRIIDALAMGPLSEQEKLVCSFRNCQRNPGKEHRYCTVHRKTISKSVNSVHQARMDVGLCITCCKPNNSATQKCNECNKRRAREAFKKRRENTMHVPGHLKRDHRKLGLCTYCDRPGHEGRYHRYCIEHAEEHRKRMRQLADERVQAGTCARCGLHPIAKHSESRCTHCLRYQADDTAKRLAKGRAA